ncbi:unnamed protein product [Diabrotica balteata]|uniref:tRNA-splicing endonuclease subunit Sen15 domain-containing protein n=1 Tax=Diabrotica balteata TaxID=107213 RepID=A0A9N9TDV4_DIABA|nr:unnamed protein product [Diabrotica balteata]
MQDAIVEKFKLEAPEKEAILALYPYLEICEIKKYYNVNYFFNKELNKIVITGNKTKKSPPSMFVPVAVYERLNFVKLQSFIGTWTGLVYIAIVHPDSTCVYYQIANGLVEPKPGDPSSKRRIERIKRKVNRELKTYCSLSEEKVQDPDFFKIEISDGDSDSSD